jgi:hypothetical protein
LHDPRHPADLSETPDFRYCRLPLANALSKRLKGHVESNFVSELEAVGDGFSWRVNHDRHALDPVFRASLAKRRAVKANDAKFSIETRSPASSWKGHPDFAGDLSGKAMEDERRQKTHRPVGHSFSNFCKRVVLRNWGVCHPIEAPPGSFHHATTQKAQEIFSRDAGSFDVPRTQNAMALREGRNSRLNRVLQLVIIL